MNKDDFTQKKELAKIQEENIKLRHIFKMEELAYERENSKILHDQILERGRIQRAEERKIMLEKRGFR